MVRKKNTKITIKDETDMEKEKEALNEEHAEKEQEKAKADPVVDLEAKLESAEKEAKENYDRLLRVSAEFDNYKKRASREMVDFRKYSNEVLIKEMLPVIDNLERAVESFENGKHETSSIVEGVHMTLKEILKVFEKFGVTQIEAVGKPFDPNYHQAVMQEESEHAPENTAIKELQKGYMLHDRLIRPAMVIVSAAKGNKE